MKDGSKLHWGDVVTAGQKARLVEATVAALKSLLDNPEVRGLLKPVAVVEGDYGFPDLELDATGLYAVTYKERFFRDAIVVREPRYADEATVTEFWLDADTVKRAIQQIET